MEVRSRFAPSPTGYMHIGNLRTALYEYLVAKSAGGKFILRIEDTDQERYVEGAVDIIYKTMEMVGLKHDEGPDVGGPYGPYVQSERRAIYKEYADKLVDLGGAHYCFCSEEELENSAKRAKKRAFRSNSATRAKNCRSRKRAAASPRVKNTPSARRLTRTARFPLTTACTVTSRSKPRLWTKAFC